MQNGKIQGVSFLRVYLTFFILTFHLFQNVNLGRFYPRMAVATNMGEKAVEMFFIISGYFLIETFNKNKDIKSFFIKRYNKFLPCLMVVCAFYYLFIFVSGGGATKFWETLSDILLINNLLLFKEYGIIGGSWFLSVLVWVSAFYFCVFKFFPSEKAFFIVSVITMISTAYLVQRTNGTLKGLKYIGLLRGISCIGLGILLHIFPKIKLKKNLNTFFCVLFLFLIFRWCLIDRISRNNYIVVILMFSVLLKMIIDNDCFIIKQNFFDNISKYCLDIYVSHLFLFKVLNFYVWPRWNNISVIIFSYVLSIVFGCLINFLTYKFTTAVQKYKVFWEGE